MRFPLKDLPDIEAKSIVTWVENNQLGLEFTGIKGDGLNNLRTIVVENAESPGDAETEFLTLFNKMPESY